MYDLYTYKRVKEGDRACLHVCIGDVIFVVVVIVCLS